MGQKEALLEGARQCLIEKGYARTSARDIVKAAGVNLSAISYHYGSKDALLNQVLVELFSGWADRVREAAFQVETDNPVERLALAWYALIGTFDENRQVFIAFVEALTLAERSDELRDQMAVHYREARSALVELLDDLDSEPEADMPAIASLLIAICDGLFIQWLLDPKETPTGERLAGATVSLLKIVEPFS